MRKNLWVEVKNITYHRNGVGGICFFSIAFDYLDGDKQRSMVASVFLEQGYCAVIDVNDPTACWRGDQFEEVLRPILKNYLAR